MNWFIGLLFFFLILTWGYTHWLQRERKEGGWREKETDRDRDADLRERHQSVASHTCPDRGLNPQPRYMPWPGIEPTTFQFMGWCTNQLSRPHWPGHGWLFLYNYDIMKFWRRQHSEVKDHGLWEQVWLWVPTLPFVARVEHRQITYFFFSWKP